MLCRLCREQGENSAEFGHSFQTIADSQLSVNMGNVCADGGLCHEELFGDVINAVISDEKLNHIELSGGKAIAVELGTAGGWFLLCGGFAGDGNADELTVVEAKLYFRHINTDSE